MAAVIAFHENTLKPARPEAWCSSVAPAGAAMHEKTACAASRCGASAGDTLASACIDKCPLQRQGAWLWTSGRCDMQGPQEGLAASGFLRTQTCCKQCRPPESSRAVQNHLNSCTEAPNARCESWHQPVLHQHPASAVQRLDNRAACVPLLLQGHCACNCCTQLPVNARLLRWCLTATGDGAVLSWGYSSENGPPKLRHRSVWLCAATRDSR